MNDGVVMGSGVSVSHVVKIPALGAWTGSSCPRYCFGSRRAQCLMTVRPVILKQELGVDCSRAGGTAIGADEKCGDCLLLAAITSSYYGDGRN